MYNSKDKKIWRFNDKMIIGFALESFLKMKGKKVHDDVLLSDADENLNQSAQLFSSALKESILDGYKKNPSNPDKEYKNTTGSKAKKEKGESAKAVFIKELQDKFNNDWGDKIDVDVFSDPKGRKKALSRERKEQTQEEIRSEKKKRISIIKKRIAELTAELETLQKEIGE